MIYGPVPTLKIIKHYEKYTPFCILLKSCISNPTFAMKSQTKDNHQERNRKTIKNYEPEKTSKEGWVGMLSAAVEEEEEEHWQLWVLSLNGAMSESFLENGVEQWRGRENGKRIWFGVFIKVWGGMESGGPKQVSAIITVVEEANTLHLKIKFPFFLF